MSFERRDFLKLLGLSASATALGPIAVVWVDDDLYVNRRLGLRLRKPKGWHFLSIREMGQLKNEQQLVTTDEKFMRDLLDDIGLPLVSMSQAAVQEESDPQIHLWVEPDDGKPSDVVKTHQATYNTVYAPLLKDFRFEQRAKAITFAGHDASECVVRFTYEGKNGFTEPVRLRSIFFPRGEVNYTINMGDNLAGWSDEVTQKFESVLASVEFVDSPAVR